jgi:hypothetical protein
VKSRQTKLEDGRLVSETLEGEADRGAYDQMVRQAQQRAVDQSGFLPALTVMVAALAGAQAMTDWTMASAGQGSQQSPLQAWRSGPAPSDAFRGAARPMFRRSSSTSATDRFPPLVLSGTARSFPSPLPRSRGCLGIPQRLHIAATGTISRS